MIPRGCVPITGVGGWGYLIDWRGGRDEGDSQHRGSSPIDKLSRMHAGETLISPPLMELKSGIRMSGKEGERVGGISTPSQVEAERKSN